MVINLPSRIAEIGKSGLQELINESNSYAEVLEKMGMSSHGRNYDTLRKYINIYEIDLSKIEENRRNVNLVQVKDLHRKNEIPLESIINGEYHQPYKGTRLKMRLIEAGHKEHRCEHCGLTEWLGKPIPLQLHHKDGNHNNNTIDNLELLCPNCHSLTDTYAGRNIKNKRRVQVYKKKRAKRKEKPIPVDRETLKDEIRNHPFVKVGELHGVTDNAIRKWCIRFGLPNKVRDIRSYDDCEWAKL